MLWSALMRIVESPSRITLFIPISIANSRARLAASVSTSSTIAGSWICCESEAKTSPTSLRTTTPIPAQFSLLKSAPSKFILTLSWSGGLQQEASVVVDGNAGLWNVENSGNLYFACSCSWDSDDVNLTRQKLFR